MFWLGLLVIIATFEGIFFLIGAVAGGDPLDGVQFMGLMTGIGVVLVAASALIFLGVNLMGLA